jgi:hypothetical protein
MFFAIIVHASDLQSLVILPKNNVHNLYFKQYYTQDLLFTAETQALLPLQK